MLRALRQQHRRLGMIDDRHQHRRRTDRPHLGDLPHHRIGVVIAALWRHARIGQAGRHVERQTLPHAREEFDPPSRPVTAFVRLASRELPQRAGFRHGEELAAGDNAEHRLAADVAFLAECDQIVEQRPRHLGPQVAAHMQIRLEPAVRRLLLETQRMAWPGRNPVVDIGAELKNSAQPSPADVFISTARNGASSTTMPTFSTGVTRKYLSPSRLSTEANNLTKAGRPIGVFW